MRRVLWMAFVLCLIATDVCAKEQQPDPLLPCPSEATKAACNPSKKDAKDAEAAFKRGVRLQSKDMDQAYDEFVRAANLAPRNVNYITAREVARQRLVTNYIETGSAELNADKQVQAIADFRSALRLDPGNDFAQQRLRDALASNLPQTQSPPEVIEQASELLLQPNLNVASFHFRGDSRELLNMIAAAYGVTANVDDSVVSRRVTFDIDKIDFYKAMIAAGDVTKTFWSPLDSKQMLIVADTPENRRQYERMAMRKFYIPSATTMPTALNDVMNLLRNLFDIRNVTPNAGTATLVVRAPQRTLDAATDFLRNLDGSRPQVMVDVRVYQISHNLTRNLGVHIPYTFNIFNIPAGALAALGGQNIQQEINQLIASGGINQANNTALSALLAQLQQQQGQNSIFSQPLATFGGGKTLMGVTLDQLSAQLSLNESWIKTLDHATLRAAQGNDATFMMGSRYPILNATFAPLFNTPAISQVIQNNTFQAAFPSFTYEDLGLTIKAKPYITSNNDVSVQLEMALRALTGQSLNGVPVIGNREYKGTITLRDGEPALVAGQVTHTETLAMSGLPGMGLVPGLNKITTTNSKEVDDDELLIVITPRIISRKTGQNSLVYLPK